MGDFEGAMLHEWHFRRWIATRRIACLVRVDDEVFPQDGRAISHCRHLFGCSLQKERGCTKAREGFV